MRMQLLLNKVLLFCVLVFVWLCVGIWSANRERDARQQQQQLQQQGKIFGIMSEEVEERALREADEEKIFVFGEREITMNEIGGYTQITRIQVIRIGVTEREDTRNHTTHKHNITQKAHPVSQCEEGGRLGGVGDRVDPLGCVLPERATEEAWTEVPVSNANHFERLQPCASAEATELNAKGVEIVLKFLNATTPKDPTPAKSGEHFLRKSVEYFGQALAIDAHCDSAHLNLAIILYYFAEYTNGGIQLSLVRDAATGGNVMLSRKKEVWDVIYREIIGGVSRQQITGMCQRVIARHAEVGVEYFPSDYKLDASNDAFIATECLPVLAQSGRKFSFFMMPAKWREITHTAVAKLLLAKEFASHLVSPKITANDANDFQEKWRLNVRGIIDTFTLGTLQDYYEDMIANGFMLDNTPDVVKNRFHLLNDPPSRLILANLQPIVQRLASRGIASGYANTAKYHHQAHLSPHYDRNFNDYVISLNVGVQPTGGSCSLGLSSQPLRREDLDSFFHTNPQLPPPEQRMLVTHRPGDGFLFRARHFLHWREMPVGLNCTQMFLRYRIPKH